MGLEKLLPLKCLLVLSPHIWYSRRWPDTTLVKSPDEVRQKIGMVPQLVSLYGDLTARERRICADYYGCPGTLRNRELTT